MGRLEPEKPVVYKWPGRTYIIPISGAGETSPTVLAAPAQIKSLLLTANQGFPQTETHL